MLEWLTRRRRRNELPEYSRLRAVPTRPLPADLTSEETRELEARCEVIGQELRAPGHRPQEDVPLFTELVLSGRVGAVTFPLPDGSQCLPVFSTPFRAGDYVQVLLTSLPRVQYLSSSGIQLLGMIRDLEQVGVNALALDRCPRCSITTTYRTGSIKTASDLIEVWAIQKAIELVRMSLYLRYAIKVASQGQLETARDVALETVGHVSQEDPRPHLLLGELAIGLGDRKMLREARQFLVYFKHDPWLVRLERSELAGNPTFDERDYTSP